MISQETPPDIQENLQKSHLSRYNTDFELILSPDLLSVKTRIDDGYEWLWRSKRNYLINYNSH